MQLQQVWITILLWNLLLPPLLCRSRKPDTGMLGVHGHGLRCRITDEFISRAYNSSAQAGHLGNSLAHLMFALSASLQGVDGTTAARGFNDAALQSFALLMKELGRIMSYLFQACHSFGLLSLPCLRCAEGQSTV